MLLQNTIVTDQVNSLFQKNLPQVPLCINDFSRGFAPKRRWQENAIRYKNIQHNAPYNLGTLAFDLDYDVFPDDLYPRPNMLVQNEDNGKAHALIFLDKPVHAHCFSSLKAQAYYKRALKAITAAYGGDPAYVNRLCKNPLSKRFRVHAIRPEPYTLDQLSEWIPANQKIFNVSKLKLDDFLGLGRNCDTFHRGRFWSYTAIREFVNAAYRDFYEAVYEYCYKANYEFNPTPLPINEIRSISKSIARWVFDKRFDLTTFSKQSFRGKRSGKVRHEAMLQNKQRAITLLGQGLKIKDIASELNVSERTIYNWLKDYEL